MTDLSEVEREAFRRAFPPPFDDLGPAGICTCDTYPVPIEDHGDECAVRALYEGWMARREYSKQREEKLRLAEHRASVRHQEERIRREKVEERERELEQEAAAESASHADTITRAEQLVDAGRERERALDKALVGLVEWCAGPLGLERHPAADSNSHDEPINCLLSLGTLRAGIAVLGKARAVLAENGDSVPGPLGDRRPGA